MKTILEVEPTLTMESEDRNRLNLIENVFRRFLLQTQSDSPQLSRDYFERFTQLLNQSFIKYPILKPSIEAKISSIISPFHASNIMTFEYQLRLIRFSLRQHLRLSELTHVDFLDQLLHHAHLRHSSIVRHLALQIATLIYDHNLHPFFDETLFAHMLQLLSSDPNLYVRHALAQFLALYISKHDRYRLCNQIVSQSHDADLLYTVLILLDEEKQSVLIKQLDVYANLVDSPAVRAFVLKTAKCVKDEDQLVSYLQRLLKVSLSDYVHSLLAIISSRAEHHRSTVQLTACLKGLFLYIRETDIEEIDEHSSFVTPANQDDELTEHVCCQLFERDIVSADLACLVVDAIQPFTLHSHSFIYKLDFYSTTIAMMLKGEIGNEKQYAQLMCCLDKLHEFHPSVDCLTKDLCDTIIHRVLEKRRSTIVYQSLLNLILHVPQSTVYLELMVPMLEILLFEENEQWLQWDRKDCALHFLIQLVQTSKDKTYPSWFTEAFLRRVIEKLVHHSSEYIQGSLIDLLGALVECDLLSPLDDYLTSNFVQLTQHSLADVVRCALAHAWYIVLTKSNDRSHSAQPHRFSFGTTISHESLRSTVTAQIPLLIGDGGHETEIQCLRLIEYIGVENQPLANVLDFLVSDGCSDEIKSQARRLLLPTANAPIGEKKSNEILEDELSSILHWLDHPDEHMILDCD